MIAVDASKFIHTTNHVRGPGVLVDTFLQGCRGKNVSLIYNPHFIGSQFYFNALTVDEYYKQIAEHQNVPPSSLSGKSLRKQLLKRILKRLAPFVIRWLPELKEYAPVLRNNLSQHEHHHLRAPIVHHSTFTKVLSFLASDSIWGLPMPHSQKTLFLFDITFFEILRMISTPALTQSSPFIVQHITQVNRALSEASSVITPTHYLAQQVPLHFPVAVHKKISVVPLASSFVAQSPQPQRTTKRIEQKHHFSPMRRTATFPKLVAAASNELRALIVCGFDGFKNDNKGMGHMLDIIALHKLLFPNQPIRFTFVTPGQAALHERIEALGIADHVTILSVIPKNILEEEFRKAKFLWVHSIDEGFCLPVLEAAILGIPALISDIPSLRELWGNTVDYINVFNRYEAVNRLHAYGSGARHAPPQAHTAHAQQYTVNHMITGIWRSMGEAA